jgi:hypothetical protein
MNFKHVTMMLSLVGVALVPSVARADHYGSPVDVNFGVGIEIGNRHVHSHDCGHRPVDPPPGYSGRRGRYELQTVSHWVPGRFEEVWVPERCKTRGHGRRVKCKGGFYDRRWVPAHQIQSQEWVWVPAVYTPPPPPVHRGGRVVIRASF